MKCFHVHMHVDDPGSEHRLLYPAVRRRSQHAWSATTPNGCSKIPSEFRHLHARRSKPALDHRSFQVDERKELAALKARAEAADLALLDEGTTACCYARSATRLDYDSQVLPGSTFIR